MLTRRQQQEQSICVNGLNMLPEDVWGLIFSHLSTREICASVQPVCRLWRRMGFDATKENFILPLGLGPGMSEVAKKREDFVSSLVTCLLKRTKTLKILAMRLTISDNGMKRLAAATLRCRQLVILDLLGNSDGRSIDLAGSLPLQLEVLRSNYSWKCYGTGPPRLQILELGGYSVFGDAQQEWRHGDLRAMVTFTHNPSLMRSTANLTRLQYLELLGSTKLERVVDLAMLIPSLKFLVVRSGYGPDRSASRLSQHQTLEKLCIGTIVTQPDHLDGLKELLLLPTLYSLRVASLNSLYTVESLKQISQVASTDGLLAISKLAHLKIYSPGAVLAKPEVDLAALCGILCLSSLEIGVKAWAIPALSKPPANGQCAIKLECSDGFSAASRANLRAGGFQLKGWELKEWEPNTESKKRPRLAKIGPIGRKTFCARQFRLDDALPSIETECKRYKPYDEFLKQVIV